MKRTIYAIQVGSLKQCLEHLHMMNLEELAVTAQEHGTEAERKMIAAVIAFLATVPSGHP